MLNSTCQRELRFTSNYSYWTILLSILTGIFRRLSFSEIKFGLDDHWFSFADIIFKKFLSTRGKIILLDVERREDRLLKIYETIFYHLRILILFHLWSKFNLKSLGITLFLHFIQESHFLFWFIPQFDINHFRTQHHHSIPLLLVKSLQCLFALAAIISFLSFKRSKWFHIVED